MYSGRTLGWSFVGLFCCACAFGADESGFGDRVLPLVEKHCAQCHSGSEPEAGLSFDTATHATHVDDHPDLWEEVADKLRRHEMPPADRPQPTPEQTLAAVNWIDGRIARLMESQKPSPGRVTLRRLNRVEYNNTIRDLVGVDFQPAENFPADDTGYGFDNNGDVLSLPPLLMEKYLSAAEQIINQAIVDPVRGESILQLEGASMQRIGAEGWIDGTVHELYSDGLLEAGIRIPATASYEIAVNAYGKQAGADPARMSVRMDGNEVRLVDVPATRDRPGQYVVFTKLPEGDHKLGLAFVNDFYRPDNPDASQRDRNLTILSFEVRKDPGAAWDQLPDVHRRILLRPLSGSNRTRLAKESIRRFASRAYRRPVSGPEVHRLMRLFREADGNGATFEKAIKLPLTAILVSPQFLFRVEVDPQQKVHDGARDLNDFELASRLSYFLWSSMPDDELFEVARTHGLTRGGKLEAQVGRMLDDPKASALVQSFAVQWLQLRKLGMMTPDADRFPGYSTALQADMRRETELFFAAVLRENRPITDLLDADFTFVNERLAKHYGIEGVVGDEFRRVSVSRDVRGGILGHASVLTLTSNPTRTSPVKRGKWVLENLLGTPPPPPPADVPELPDEQQSPLVGTLRERMEQHRSDTACSVCHARIDPVGFGLENYDAVGRWRTHDGETPIDASGTLPDGTSFNGPGDLKKWLSSKKDDFSRCFVKKMLTYALGRGLTRSDQKSVDEIVVRAGQDGYKIRNLVVSIIQSEPFQRTAVE
jgi:hypothetical protein